MRVAIRKWGNSLALRIPKALAEDTQLESGSEVDAVVEDGRLVITPVRARRSLAEMVAAVTDENIHPEAGTGKAVGKEVW